MLSIGDFSQVGRVSVRTLRHYDDLGLLKPIRIDRFTNYRYYTLDQLPRLNRILMFKDLGLSLDQIATLLNDNPSLDELREMLVLKQTELAHEVQERQAQLDRVALRLGQIEQEGNLLKYDVTLKEAAPQHIVSTRQIVPTLRDMGDMRCKLYDRLYTWVERNRIEVAEPEFAIYHNSEYVEQDIDMEAGIFVARLPRGGNELASGEVGIRELAGETLIASMIYRCRPDESGGALVALYAWLGENEYSTCGPYREIHLYGRELDLTSYAPISIEVQVPVRQNQ